MPAILDAILHVDRFLPVMAAAWGPWLYAGLFLVVFCETGLVVMPFLPGDSLLFLTGALCAQPDSALCVGWMGACLLTAAVLGDAANYAIGNAAGKRLLGIRSRFVNRQHVESTERFFERHGAKAVVLARFAPILRTFAPFVAGIGRMAYRRFFAFNVIGAALWVGTFLTAGYLFGGTPFVSRNLHAIVVAIVVLSLLPPVIEFARSRRQPIGT